MYGSMSEFEKKIHPTINTEQQLFATLYKQMTWYQERPLFDVMWNKLQPLGSIDFLYT